MELPAVAPLASLTPARERTIQIEPALSRLFPDAGLQRGHIIGCRGVAARSLSLALAARPVAAGAWLAVVGLDDFGVEAAVELGVPAERVVAIAATTAHEWAERTAAAADGFELILTAPPTGADRAMRQVRQRLKARGGVLIAVPRSGSGAGSCSGADIEISTSDDEWYGIGAGHGRLMARRVTVRSSGRRVPRPVTVDCWLPGPDGRVDVVQTGRSDIADSTHAEPSYADHRDVVSRAS